MEDRAWGWANESFALLALQLYGLFSHDDETRINVAFVAGLAAFLMSMSTSAFFGSFAPLLTARSLSLTAITLFGVFSGWRGELGRCAGASGSQSFILSSVVQRACRCVAASSPQTP